MRILTRFSQQTSLIRSGLCRKHWLRQSPCPPQMTQQRRRTRLRVRLVSAGTMVQTEPFCRLPTFKQIQSSREL
jgi:hypothetical protein